MAATPCPSYGDLLAALEGEFRAVDSDAVDAALDELALPLFGIDAAPFAERALALGRAAWAALPDEAETPPAWLLDAALQRGCGAAPVRAALAAELGRRAGVPAHPVRLRGCWAIHVPGEPAGVAADVGADADGAGTGPHGCMCAHALSFIVLTRLAAAWESVGNAARARHARVLRLALSAGRAA